MASAKFLEDALSTNVDESAVNAIVGSLENQLVTSSSSSSSQNNIGIINQSQIGNISSSGSSIIGVQKYNADHSSNLNFTSSPNTSVSFNHVQGSIQSGIIVSQPNLSNISKCNETLKVIYSQSSPALHSPVTSNRVTYPAQSLPNGGLSLAGPNIIHTVAQNPNKITMQTPLVIKQGTSSGQVGIQPGMVTVPMTVNSSMAGSLQNVMTLNKPGQNVVASTQNMGGQTQQTIIPNVQILNMRPSNPGVAAQKSVATVSPRVVIGAPQVVGARAANPGITLQTLQGLQPGHQGHLLLKTENGQYQLLRVGPAPQASTLAAPQAQSLRLSTVPSHPGVATVSTSVAAPQLQQQPPQQQMQQPPMPPVIAAPAPPVVAPPQPSAAAQKLSSDNTKEKCRNFLANLLDLSSKEPKSVERNVRNLIQELIDAQVEPEEFCDRLEKLLNASPQPCLIGFLKKSLPLLRQSLVTKELIIEGINPPSPHIAFSTVPAPTHQQTIVTSNLQMTCEGSGLNGTLTALLPPVQSVALATVATPGLVPAQQSKQINIVSVTEIKPPQVLLNQHQPKPPATKAGNTIAVLQNIPIQPQKLNLNKVSSPKGPANMNKSYSRVTAPSAALSTVLTPGKSLLRDKERKSPFASQHFADDKMAGDDDINDVAAMGGVNLAEESQRILGSTELIGTQIRSCKDEFLVPSGVMQARLKVSAARHGLEEPSAEVGSIISHAVHERLKNIVEKLAIIAQHRIDMVIKTDTRYEVTQDVKSQLKFLEELDRVEKKRREDSEREMLLRAAKSRSKTEDPEQAKLKAKAKEMQRAELEELRQREANLTALQAIGPRKKPKLEGPGGGGGGGDTIGNGGSHGASGFSGRSQLALRTRLKRINQRDVVFLLEQERETAHSAMLYRSYLK